MSPGIVTLTEEQAHALVHDDLDGVDPCQMNEAVSLDDHSATSVALNARILMAELDGKGARLTAKGNRKLGSSGRAIPPSASATTRHPSTVMR